MTEPTVLVIDDEPDIRDLLAITLGRMAIECLTVATLAEAYGLLRKRTFQLCLTDMNLPDGNGIELVQWMQQHCPTTPVAVITAYGSMETAITALKTGAFDFVSKPIELPRLRALIDSALRLPQAPASEPEPTQEQLITGDSPAMATLRAQARKVSRSQAPVYISGESGSGKELVARLIHQQGPRKDSPFIPVNCGAIPAELMESEFFGHRKGSFTGASEHKDGLFTAAHQGTLFLDEVADLPLSMQVKLLRAIQEKAVRPVGASEEVTVDVRILSATHKDLAALVEEGLFRQDLYYRINVIELRVPPLRERPEDIQPLAKQILGRISAGIDDSVKLDECALSLLSEYSFPGNVRELENILERAFTLCEGPEIKASDLQLGSGVTPATGEQALLPPGDLNLEHYLEHIERQTIEQALSATRWNKTAAAKKLGISFRALRYRLKKLDME
ncbi:MAG: sigma-54-dependent Fis family transcriptional regulator [Halomonadaceae bacterium]|nr:MAG: sigma-54-dependent Fis family transcriptional regulator [Halomonadaceae bacterium]